MQSASQALAITEENHAEWLAARPRQVGSSDAADVAGVGRDSPVEVWQRKLGLAPPVPLTPEMRWGKKLEPIVAEAYREETGRRFEEQLQFVHPERDWMTATLDGLCDDGRIVEIKTASVWARDWGEELTDQIPTPYLVQVHHQMAVTGATEADVALLIGGSDFRIYPVRRNEDVIASLLDIEEHFHKCVERQVPPWWGRLDARVLAMIYPGCSGEIALVEPDVVKALALFEDACFAIKRLGVMRQDAQAVVLAALGNAQFGLLPDGRKVKRFRVEVPERMPERPTRAHTRHYFVTVGDKARPKGDRACPERGIEERDGTATANEATAAMEGPAPS